MAEDTFSKNPIQGPNANENNTANYMMPEPSAAWSVGVNPTDSSTPILAKTIGNGQLGAGVKAPALDVATPLVLPPAIIVILQVPGMYTADGPSAMAYAIKDMFESHARQVSGLELNYSNDPMGDLMLADGQTFQSPGKTKRSSMNPSFQFSEVTGNLFWNIIRKWLTDINPADTYAVGPNVHISGGWTMSAYSMTMAVIQPDVTGRPERILDCSIVCNMFPQATGDFGYSRSVSTMNVPDRTFNFTGIQQHNAYTKQIGRLIMEKLQMHKLDFDWAPPQRDIWTPSLEDAGIQRDITLRMEEYPRSNDTDELGNVTTAGHAQENGNHVTNINSFYQKQNIV